MKTMLTGAALLALAATSALAEPGNGGGNGNGQGGHGDHQPAAAQNERGNGGANGGGGGNARQGQARSEVRQAVGRANGESGNGDGNGNGNSEARGAVDAGSNALARDRDRDSRDWRQAPSRYVYNGDRNGSSREAARYVGLLDGCPPGLAAKHNGCQPPGQARKSRYLVRDRYDLGWWGLPRHDEGFYRYDSGYLLRLGSNGSVASYIPLLGGALSVGNAWPNQYGYDQLSPYYTRYYGLGETGSYRFADNAIYRLDPTTAAITSIAALLTCDDFTVGQQLPTGYDVYNVPYTYRDQYQDSQEANYRYSDGYVYEVDPTTRLITSAIELLTS